jgi:hypothetical protein
MLMASDKKKPTSMLSAAWRIEAKKGHESHNLAYRSLIHFRNIYVF